MKRPTRFTKSSKNIDNLYKEGQCRVCTVVVTRMDFAKILGKFTKVKIQYESSTSPKQKTKAPSAVTSPNTNSRLKSNENGMVLIHRNAYKEHPVKDAAPSKKPNQVKSPIINAYKEHPVKDAASSKKPNQVKSPIINLRAVTRSVNNNNVLKENNRLKKTPVVKEKVTKTPAIRKTHARIRQYHVTFTSPKKQLRPKKNSISLLDLLPSVDKSLLPSEDWCIHYLPNTDEPKEDKVYDRIAAELEDLMYNEKTILKSEGKTADSDGKGDEFPSILDILNENPSETSKLNDQIILPELKSNLASSDVEAMLLGNIPEDRNEDNPEDITEPASPSILDELSEKPMFEPMDTDEIPDKAIKGPTKIEIDTKGPAKEITHLVFKKLQNGTCMKSVTCPKTLEYNIELVGKPIELLGAPRYVSSREDLQVLLQIVNDSELESLYVQH